MIKRVVAIALLLGVAWMARSQFWKGSHAPSVLLTVRPGESARQIAENLREQGVLRSEMPFLVWARLRHASVKLRVGRYRISKDRSAFWIVDDLVRGRMETIRVTVPEGFASWQIGERLENLGLVTKEEFVQTVQKEGWEGFLFPATYDLSSTLTGPDIGQTMVKEFDRRWTTEFEARAKAIGLTKKKAVTLASILEREIRVREELPLISAVYHNRLKIRMKLDADPTVQYALGYWKAPLTYDDYRSTRSPYNTYLNQGLPPGPICSPGEDALRAALTPAQSDALYFVAQEDGRHIFSKTYRDHVNKVNRRNRDKKNKKSSVGARP